MPQGIDIGRRLSLDEVDLLRSRGFRFAARYYAGDQSNPKTLTAAEIAYLLSRGFAILPVFQTSANFPGYFTYANGIADGQAARADGLALGQPLGTPICFAVDTDISDPSAQLTDYFNGVFAGIDGAYLIGIYGEYDVVKFARENFPALGYFWLTYAWSGGRDYIPADVFQHANGVEIAPGLVVDVNFAADPPPWRLG